ncbi:alpha-amylase family glycosyl hydrolase [Shewanella sp. NIFS-20-20]|uniref:alpha-amylase family glycosyl hydrolase n=1 Tax=Shewanella sp. NIFS-20-20 TaxID=2853806 RepID=UPI001C43B061|nr:alpha-amylase family glycosyl hydrolase [Shewanella sp. NIFS-20-20]MBV7315272.1 cyclomaltodextrin glucanotransferase [Shewanella sp. NIFS-20-20]
MAKGFGLAALLVCGQTLAQAHDGADLVGTTHPFASKAVYFVVTDRFVDGDTSNNYPQDSGYRLPITINGQQANVGFMGGDFKGLLQYADYIAEMGFGAIWLTPIVQNPAQAFSGGDEIKAEGFAMDRHKAGYHGYWGTNFYRLDKHLPSPDLDFKQLNQALNAKGLETIVDVVINHGSPAYSMTSAQAQSSQFGKLYDSDGLLVADHGNLAPEQLQRQEPLQSWFNSDRDLAQLADMNTGDPRVMDYFVGAYLHWLEQGASAMRIDTVKHVPSKDWGEFSRRIRDHYPDLFMFGEVYSFDANEIGQYTRVENGGMSVLDFPLKAALNQVFAEGAAYRTLLPALYLAPSDNPYHNPYELLTFYDNHDMPRMQATDAGFIDAHHWLFTARGIPVIYYGSEMGFERGKAEHQGNRNYFGAAGIDVARDHVIRAALIKIANLRKQLVSLQRGLQINLDFGDDTAAFYRVYRQAEHSEVSLVLLNKGDKSQTVTLTDIPAGDWYEPLSAQRHPLSGDVTISVPAHGVRVLVLTDAEIDASILARLAPHS